ncbi:MAG TPA: beta-phosphoglucomutase family hydrolase [Nitriliruptorales bacterium]|nr:beta-phosphoglucomutase family hydrolase [Nitriliruptorales bacterium]
MTQRDHPAVIDLDRIEAVVFDMDGVVTDTASLHARAWKQTFDTYLRRRSGGSFEPFTDTDYLRYVDGRPRYDGVAAFLDSRGIDLPYGDPRDPPHRDTVCGLANAKNQGFLELLSEQGAERYESTVRLVGELRDRGVAVAVISASRNAPAVLAAAGVGDIFDVRVDGGDAAALGLNGKPDPGVFLEAVRRLGAEPHRAAVVEDALAGVQAGRAGGFALVIGVDRGGHADELLAAGADVVVGDLAEVQLAATTQGGAR